VVESWPARLVDKRTAGMVRVRGPDGRRRWIKAVDLRLASDSQAWLVAVIRCWPDRKVSRRQTDSPGGGTRPKSDLADPLLEQCLIRLPSSLIREPGMLWACAWWSSAPPSVSVAYVGVAPVPVRAFVCRRGI